VSTRQTPPRRALPTQSVDRRPSTHGISLSGVCMASMHGESGEGARTWNSAPPSRSLMSSGWALATGMFCGGEKEESRGWMDARGFCEIL
jgi:hypothetical protein